MFRAANGAAVQTQGGGYTAAVQRAIAQGDKAGLMELAKPANYGSALRTPDAQQALSLARRNLGSGKKAQVSTAPSVDVADVEQISMGNLPTKAAPIYSLPMFGSLQTGQQGPSSPRVSDESLGIPAMVSETSQPPAAPSTGTNTSIQSILQTLFPKLGAQAAETPAPAPSTGVPDFVTSTSASAPSPASDSGLAALKPRTTTPAFPMLAASASGTLEDTVMRRVLNDPIDLGMPASTKSTAEEVSEETGTPAGDTTDTQAGAADDAKKAAGDAGATTTNFGDPFANLDLAVSGEAGKSDQEKTLRQSLDLIIQSNEGLSTASADRVAMAQSRAGDAAAKLEAALSKDPKKAKEITLSDVKKEALKLTGFDEGKYSEGRENAFWMAIMKAGLATAAGESNNTLTNIAKGLGIGLEGYGQDLNRLNQQEREDRKELRNTQLMLIKNKQDLENAWVATENDYQNRLIQLRAAQEQGAQANLIAAQTADTQFQLALNQFEATTAKSINDAERADRKIDMDNAFRVWSTKLNTLPEEVKKTVFLGPEFGSIDDEGNISFTETGEKFYKDLITASQKTGYKITDLMNTATSLASQESLYGFDITKRADGTPTSQGDRIAIALAWQKDDVLDQARRRGEAAAQGTRKSSEKQAAANKAEQDFINNWFANQRLVPYVPPQQQQAAVAAEAPAPAAQSENIFSQADALVN